MKKTFIISFIALIGITARGQQLSSQVIASSGAFFTASSGVTLSFSLGECVTQTYSNSSGTLAQGFQQGYYEVTPLSTENEISMDMKVYPLPATDFITIEFSAGTDKYLAWIYDINGKPVLTGQLVQESTNLNLEELIPGTYILVITDNTKNVFKTVQIIKK